MFAPTVLASFFLLAGHAAAQFAPIHTPDLLYQDGHEPFLYCEQFYQYLGEEGVNCVTIAEEHKIDVEEFLRINPQMNQVPHCHESLWYKYWYCVKSMSVENMVAVTPQLE